MIYAIPKAFCLAGEASAPQPGAMCIEMACRTGHTVDNLPLAVKTAVAFFSEKPRIFSGAMFFSPFMKLLPTFD